MRTQQEIIAKVREWAVTLDPRYQYRAKIASQFLTAENAPAGLVPPEIVDAWPEFHKTDLAGAMRNVLSDMRMGLPPEGLWAKINELHALIWLSGSDADLGAMYPIDGLTLAEDIAKHLQNEPYKIDATYKIIHS